MSQKIASRYGRASHRSRTPKPSRRRSYPQENQKQSRFSTTTKVVIGLLVTVAVLGGLVFTLWRSLFVQPMNPVAYRDSLISVSNGDLPAPPFIGWEQEMLGEPPVPLSPAKDITNVNKAECEPGGERHRALNWLVMDQAHRWSGTELYNTAYNSHIRIDATNADASADGLDYEVVDQWLTDCAFVSFDQGDRTVRITYTPLEVDMKVWGMNNGRAWVQTMSTTTPEGYQGATSTITTLGSQPGITLKADMTFRGRLDDNAVATMDLLWSAQSAKAKAVQQSQ